MERALQGLREPDRLAVLHNDYGFLNIMASPDGGRVIGLFDSEHVSLGDPIFDLAKLTWADLGPEDEKPREAYLSGYEAETGQMIDRRLLSVYEALVGLGSAAWVDKQEYVSPADEIFRNKGLQKLLGFCRGTLG